MTLIGPKVQPKDFGMEPHDLHLVVNDEAETCKVFTGKGTQLAVWPALARGQKGDTTWDERWSDTPPGLWIVTKVYRDWEHPSLVEYRTRISYGWYSFAMRGLEQQETRFHRSGIMLHGGGSALGELGWSASMQPLLPTLGCIRLHNKHTQDLTQLMDQQSATIFISVYQEAE